MSSIIQLRRLLAERFPGARAWPEATAHGVWPTGIARLDEVLQGGLARGGMTEITGGPGAGSALVLRRLLCQCQATGQLMGLIDGQDSFDPEGVEAAALGKLFWARCRNAEEALKAADILLRDRNWPLVALDLKMNPPAQLRKISGTTWHRWQRVIRQSGTTLVVFTPYALAAGVEARVILDNQWTLETWEQEEEQLLAGMKFELARWARAAAG